MIILKKKNRLISNEVLVRFYFIFIYLKTELASGWVFFRDRDFLFWARSRNLEKIPKIPGIGIWKPRKNPESKFLKIPKIPKKSPVKNSENPEIPVIAIYFFGIFAGFSKNPRYSPEWDRDFFRSMGYFDKNPPLIWKR